MTTDTRGWAIKDLQSGKVAHDAHYEDAPNLGDQLASDGSLPRFRVLQA